MLDLAGSLLGPLEREKSSGLRRVCSLLYCLRNGGKRGRKCVLLLLGTAETFTDSCIFPGIFDYLF